MPAIDRFGNPVRIGWAPHVLLWIEAANHLRPKDWPEAFQDIASMSGFSLSSVKRKAEGMRAVDRAEAAAYLVAELRRNWAACELPRASRRVFVPERSQDRSPRKPNSLKVTSE